MMILEVFLAFLLPVDCAFAHLRVGEGSCQGGATSLQTPPPCPRGAPRVSAWLPCLLSGDSYSKHWGWCLSSGPGLHQFVQFMLGRDSKTGAYKNSDCTRSRQKDPRVPRPRTRWAVGTTPGGGLGCGEGWRVCSDSQSKKQ